MDMAGFESNPVAPSDKGKCQEMLLCRINLSRTLTRYLFVPTIGLLAASVGERPGLCTDISHLGRWDPLPNQ